LRGITPAGSKYERDKLDYSGISGCLSRDMFQNLIAVSFGLSK